MGEESLQRFIVELLRPLVERWLAERKIPAFTGADLFIYYRRGDATQRIAPDVFVLPGVQPGKRLKSWLTWQERIVPSLAFEVVGSDVEKDYSDAPPRYAELGVNELIIFDPDYRQDSERFRFQVFRQVGKRGLTRVLVTNEDRVFSKQLGCHVVALGSGEAVRLRLATGADGQLLFPLEAERERAEKERERAEKERERAEKERERAEKERERAARLAAEAELKRLRMLLARQAKPTKSSRPKRK